MLLTKGTVWGRGEVVRFLQLCAVFIYAVIVFDVRKAEAFLVFNDSNANSTNSTDANSTEADANTRMYNDVESAVFDISTMLTHLEHMLTALGKRVEKMAQFGNITLAASSELEEETLTLKNDAATNKEGLEKITKLFSDFKKKAGETETGLTSENENFGKFDTKMEPISKEFPGLMSRVNSALLSADSIKPRLEKDVKKVGEIEMKLVGTFEDQLQSDVQDVVIGHFRSLLHAQVDHLHAKDNVNDEKEGGEEEEVEGDEKNEDKETIDQQNTQADRTQAMVDDLMGNKKDNVVPEDLKDLVHAFHASKNPKIRFKKHRELYEKNVFLQK